MYISEFKFGSRIKRVVIILFYWNGHKTIPKRVSFDLIFVDLIIVMIVISEFNIAINFSAYLATIMCHLSTYIKPWGWSLPIRLHTYTQLVVTRMFQTLHYIFTFQCLNILVVNRGAYVKLYIVFLIFNLFWKKFIAIRGNIFEFSSRPLNSFHKNTSFFTKFLPPYALNFVPLSWFEAKF